jgi:hypothetical protein
MDGNCTLSNFYFKIKMTNRNWIINWHYSCKVLTKINILLAKQLSIMQILPTNYLKQRSNNYG